MNRPVSDLSRFNNNLQKLFATLESSYPDDADFPYYKDKIIAAQKINARLVIEQFMEAAAPFTEQIMSKDESFFLNLDIDSLVEDNSYMKLVSKIKTLWANMTPSSRDQIWKYFQIFITLGIKVNRRSDLLPILNKYRETPMIL